MKEVRVKVSWSIKKPLAMSSFAAGTVTAMSEDAHYATPDVLYVAMSASATRVEHAYNNRKNGQAGKDELANSVAEVDALLHKQAAYVTKQSGGDATIIHLGGWQTTTNTKAKTALPGQLGAPFIAAFNGGGLKVTSAAVSNANVYVFLVVIGTSFPVTLVNGMLVIPDGVVAYTLTSTKHIANFVGLPGKEDVMVAVYTVNAAGTSGLSTVAIGSTLN